MAQGHLAPGPDQGYDLDANDETLPVLQQLRARYGAICRVPSLTRPGDGLVIHDPDDIRRVLRDKLKHEIGILAIGYG